MTGREPVGFGCGRRREKNIDSIPTVYYNYIIQILISQIDSWKRINGKEFMDTNEKCFIINKMFVGDYLSLGSNIGHEVINFFSTDDDDGDGEHYLYLAPHGIVGEKKYDDRVKAVILTRQYSVGMQEIIGIAEIEKQILKKSDGDIEKQLKDYQKDHKIKYGGHELREIFKDNRFFDVEYGTARGKKDPNKLIKDAYPGKLTFKVSNFYTPKNNCHVILSDAKAKKDEMNRLKNEGGYTIYDLTKDAGKFEFGGNASQLRYFYSEDTGEKLKLYNAIKKIVESVKENDNFEKKIPPKIDDPEIKKKRKEYREKSVSYLEVMSQINRETIFSNLFRFFLDENRELMQRFCKKALGIEITAGASIEREHHHTDIWIEDDNYIIVIENKIHAGLSSPNQLKEYCDKACRARDEYKGGEKKHVRLFLIAPNHYRKIPENKLKVCGEDGKKYEYKMVQYSEIYDVFNGGKKSCNFDIRKKIRGSTEYKAKIGLYFDDFKRAILFHSGEVNLENQYAMERRFFNILDQLDGE